MNIFCGNDIIEISRIKKAIEKSGEKFLNEVFTDGEIEYCEQKKAHKYESYAARFAMKEASFKAFGDILGCNICNWKMFEIVNLSSGKPKLIIHSDKIIFKSIDISISHCNEYAIANVIGIME